MAALSHLAPTVVIRAARGSDGPALRRLAELDSRPVPAGELLVAETGDEVVAALSVDTGARVADPFRRTADVVDLLAYRARRLQDLVTALEASARPLSSGRAEAAPPWKIWTALWIVYIVWGSTYLAIALMVETMPPLLGGRHALHRGRPDPAADPRLAPRRSASGAHRARSCSPPASSA